MALKTWRISAITIFLLLLAGTALARMGAAAYGPADQSADDEFLANLDLSRIAFVQKDANGQDLLFIRIPPAMYRFAKARSRIKRRGLVRIVLRPRHYAAIEAATGKRPRHAMLRISAKRLRRAKGLKGHYVVRPLKQFMRADVSDT